MTETNLKDHLPALRRAIDAALVKVAREHDLKSLTCGKCVYDPRAGNFTFQLQGVTTRGLDPDAARYEARAKALRLPPLGASFEYGGRTHTIIGLRRGGNIATSCDGRFFGWRIHTLLDVLATRGMI